MALESRNSPQQKPAAARQIAIAQGPGGTTIDPGPNMKNFICRNTGANPVRINFNGQANGQYWELAVGEILPAPIGISPVTTIFCRGVGGASNLECLLWG
jgi:hypothetical protein